LNEALEDLTMNSMSIPKFPLSSDQLRLLLAFEDNKGLAHLSETIGRDPSVISRGLQRLVEEFPVLVKVKGRWEITPLGKKVNELTREFIKEQNSLFSSVTKKSSKRMIDLSKQTALIIINAQQGLLDATQPGRNNSDAEKNILVLLDKWRSMRLPVIHVKHVSENPASVFFQDADGCNFLPEIAPENSEEVVEKFKSSGFQDTNLESCLRQREIIHIVLTGFTANECIDATARDASALDFSTYVVGDATAMFDLRSPEGKLIKAERLHRLTLANIGALYANVVNTSDIVT
jgi:nicotinamidase-related amidase